jgi:hypothetical protein
VEGLDAVEHAKLVGELGVAVDAAAGAVDRRQRGEGQAALELAGDGHEHDQRIEVAHELDEVALHAQAGGVGEARLVLGQAVAIHEVDPARA